MEVKLGSTQENVALIERMMADLKGLMWERSIATFKLKLASFLGNHEYASIKRFMDYFYDTYLKNDSFIRWSAACQPQIYTNMETNNYIESWHNQLKTMYLERKRNRRVDRLIYILVEDVEYDYSNNVARISLKVGRMGPEERNGRRRQIGAEIINDEWLEDMCSLIEGNEEEDQRTYKVESFTNPELSYDIQVSMNNILNCTCADYNRYNLSCKHMYMLQRFKNQLSVIDDIEHEIMMQEDEVEVEIGGVEEENGQQNIRRQLLEDILTIHKALQEIDDPEVTESQLTMLQQTKDTLQLYLSELNQERIPSNSNLNTQRR